MNKIVTRGLPAIYRKLSPSGQRWFLGFGALALLGFVGFWLTVWALCADATGRVLGIPAVLAGIGILLVFGELSLKDSPPARLLPKTLQNVLAIAFMTFCYWRLVVEGSSWSAVLLVALLWVSAAGMLKLWRWVRLR